MQQFKSLCNAPPWFKIVNSKLCYEELTPSFRKWVRENICSLVLQSFKTIFPVESSDTECWCAWFYYENLGPFVIAMVDILLQKISIVPPCLSFKSARSLLSQTAWQADKVVAIYSAFEVDKPSVPASLNSSKMLQTQGWTYDMMFALYLYIFNAFCPITPWKAT